MSSPESADPLIGTVVEQKYRVDRCIGRGGMGVVYEATHLTIGKRVAMKFLDAQSAQDQEAVQRFQREALAASAVESAHIVQIFDSGVASGDQPYLVMELLRGEDLRARLSRLGRLPEHEVAKVAVQTLRALVRAHAAGIIHRDLKPDNLFLQERDDDALFVKILDFGISKMNLALASVNTLTRRGVVMGTAYYMSPEQAQAFSDIDGRADLYSLGAICFEALVGEPPHTARTYEAVLVKACTQDARPVRELAPEVSPEFSRIIQRALSKERSERYLSAEEFLQALLELSPELGLSASLTRPVRELEGGAEAIGRVATAEGTAVELGGKASLRRRRVGILAGGLVALSGVVALLFFYVVNNGSSGRDGTSSVNQALGREAPPERALPSATNLSHAERSAPDGIAEREAGGRAVDASPEPSEQLLAPASSGPTSLGATSPASPTPSASQRPSKALNSSNGPAKQAPTKGQPASKSPPLNTGVPGKGVVPDLALNPQEP